jgi:hypothetical protein
MRFPKGAQRRPETSLVLSLTVAKRPYVTLVIEAGTDLQTWIPAVVTHEDASTITAREEFPAGTPGGRFLRVRVSAP